MMIGRIALLTSLRGTATSLTDATDHLSPNPTSATIAAPARIGRNIMSSELTDLGGLT